MGPDHHDYSGAALIGSNIGMSIYAAGKAGALGFTRALAWEVAQSGVTVNAISLGMMENAAGGVSPTYRRVVQPMERWGTGRDIGAAVVWLAAEAGWVTGWAPDRRRRRRGDDRVGRRR